MRASRADGDYFYSTETHTVRPCSRSDPPGPLVVGQVYQEEQDTTLPSEHVRNLLQESLTKSAWKQWL